MSDQEIIFKSSSVDRSAGGCTGNPLSQQRTYTIVDTRLEKPNFRIERVRENGQYRYVIDGDFSVDPPPIGDSKYLNRKQCIEIYRWMLLNRRMEMVLENLFKQGKVVGGVYFGLGQEGCSCASSYALKEDEWMGPTIRNQGSTLVRGISASEIMMQYMAKAGSPTGGRDCNMHYGSVPRHIVAPVSTLGDSIPVLTGVALGARLQGKNIAVLTYIGDGGQSTGPSYEGINFAAVKKLGVVLIIENNMWAYSTPTAEQVAIKDLAERAIGYGVPGVIVDGTDPNQVYDATHEACERARRGEGPTIIEAKMMRMKGHAIHDAAAYVPAELMNYYQKRDCIRRYRDYLVSTKAWLTPDQDEKIVADVDAALEQERGLAMNSPMPHPETAVGGVYCDDSCHDVHPIYATPIFKVQRSVGTLKQSEAAVHLK